MAGAPFEVRNHDAHGDWINQRRDDFVTFTPVTGGVLEGSSGGVKTNRDAWVFSFGAERCAAKVTRKFAGYNRALDAGRRTPAEVDNVDVAWTDRTKADLASGASRSSPRTRAARPRRSWPSPFAVSTINDRRSTIDDHVRSNSGSVGERLGLSCR
ncbi:MAG TPA: type ISP restriction/modification enzyme [Jatrophihabitantaceae bacterium]